MKVSKWGNSLAIRLPADVVERLGVREGDEIDATPGMREDTVTFVRKRSRDELWARIKEIREKSPIPADYKFIRADAYDETSG